MRLAVISDIHGNVAALEAVLADAASRGVDAVLNLGDICSGPLFPAETLDRLMRSDVRSIRGNHDRQLVEDSVADMGPSDRFARDRLRAEHLEWLRSLPSTDTPYEDVLMVHGTPSNDLGYLLETVDEGGLRRASESEVLERVGSRSELLLLCGHTHLQRQMRTRDGRLILNPGSVGLPAYSADYPFPHSAESGTPHARYALAERIGRGAWAATFRMVAYDWNRVAAVAFDHGRPDWAGALRTGSMG